MSSDGPMAALQFCHRNWDVRVEMGTTQTDSEAFQTIKNKIISGDLDDLTQLQRELNPVNRSSPYRIETDSEDVERGLAKLVLTLIELIRKLVEKQALRRVEGGRLTEDEIERLGLTLMKLEQKMEGLKEHFGLSDDDLTIDLGPLGEFE